MSPQTPIARAQYYCPFNAPCVVNATAGVSANDDSPNGGTMTVQGVVTPPLSGALELMPDGSFTFTPQTCAARGVPRRLRRAPTAALQRAHQLAADRPTPPHPLSTRVAPQKLVRQHHVRVRHL